MKPVRVLIVDDSAVIRRLLSSVLENDPSIEVVGTAADGRIGLTKIEQLKPDLVTLDIEMPNLNGIETLRALRRTDRRTPVIMFSTLTERGASATIEALSLGASDYVTKPSNVGSMGLAIERVRDELIPKVKALCVRPTFNAPTAPAAPRSRPAAGSFEMVAIGSSTGGPSALREVLVTLPKSFPLPIVITQHMPPMFTKQLADRLDQNCQITVREATDGAKLAPGVALIAPGDFHMTVSRTAAGGVVRLSSAPPENFCRPSVDVMYRSIAAEFGGNVLTVMLTGMGHDGRDQTRELRDLGAFVIAQDQATSVVWGMPGAVVQAGLADEVLPLGAIGAAVNQRANGGAATRPVRPRPVLPPAPPTARASVAARTPVTARATVTR